jgi:hypothetical protein
MKKSKRYLVTKTWISGPFHGDEDEVEYTYAPKIGTQVHTGCVITRVVEL